MKMPEELVRWPRMTILYVAGLDYLWGLSGYSYLLELPQSPQDHL
jgi:hypothetical protein